MDWGENVHSLDELSHRSDGVFDGDRDINTVEVIEVDVIDPQPRQGLVERLADILWVGPHELIGIPMTETELRSKKDLVAFSGLLEPMQKKRRRG